MDVFEPASLTLSERETYEWQLDVPGIGESGQLALRNATALVSRVGGLGGPLAMELAAAGVGKLILAHGGVLRAGDLNRQILMSRDWIGRSRVACAVETLRRFKPEIEVEGVDSNISEENAAQLVGRADIVFDCAPLFEERFLMNRECVRQRKFLVVGAMFSLEGKVLPVVPGETACLACLYPEDPPHWKRRFPVLGAVSALVANIAALEGIKLLTGLGESQAGKLLLVDTGQMTMERVLLQRRPDCSVCRAT